jgi:aryl-alcohol dehydrogenase-like predicted oxidoreductase
MPLAVPNRPSQDDAIRVVHAALDAGMTWIDTADVYCLDETDIGYGERLVGRALREWSGGRDNVRVATKGGRVRPRGDWKIDGRPERLRVACEASLRALGASTIFLYQLHYTDRNVPLAESLGALMDLRTQGKIQHIGLCNVDAAQLREARRVAPILSVQNRCNPFDRECFSNGVVDACERFGIAFIAHSPVGGHADRARVSGNRTLCAIGARHGVTPHQVALAWLLSRSPSLFAIPGASRISSAVASARAADLDLTPQDQAELDTAFPPRSFTASRLSAAGREARNVARRVRARLAYSLTRWLATLAVVAVGCTATARRETAALQDAVDRFRNSQSPSRAELAQAVAGVPCTEASVCDAKSVCLAGIDPTARALLLKDEVTSRIGDLESKRLAADAPEAQALPGKLEEATRLLEIGRTKMADCEKRLIDLRLRY